MSLHEVGVRLGALDAAAAAFGQLTCLLQAHESDPDWDALVSAVRSSLRLRAGEGLTPRHVLRAATEFEPEAQRALSEAQELAIAALESLLQCEVSWDDQVLAELARIGQDAHEQYILLSRQYPVLSHFSALRRVLRSGTRLAVVDLSYCFLGDDRAAVLIGALASQQHLRLLALDANGITSRLEPLLLSLLSPDGAQRRAVAAFPSLRWLGLAANPIASRAGALRAAWRARTAAQLRPRALWCSPRRCAQMGVGVGVSVYVCVLVIEGAGMEAIVPALALRRAERDRDVLWERVSVLCATSFATIVAAGIALQLPAERIVACFLAIAARVFAIPFALQPFYAIAAWWAGGNYYAAGPLEAAVRELLGDAADMTLAEIEATTGKRLLFFAASKEKGSVALRSWGNQNRSNNNNNNSNNNSNVSLVDAILACCCAPGLVGPERRIAGHTVGDAFVVPMEQLLCECLENTEDTTAVHVELWFPREDAAAAAERAPVSLLRNPLLLREAMAAREKSAAAAGTAVPSPALLMWRRRRGAEWLAGILRGESPLSSVEEGARVSWSIVPLMKTSDPHEVRYNESDEQMLTTTIYETISSYAILAGNAMNKNSRHVE